MERLSAVAAVAVALLSILLGGCCGPQVVTDTRVVVRDTTVTIPAVVSTDTLCHEEAVDLANAILSSDSLRTPESVTVVDTATGVVVTLTALPKRGGLAVRAVLPSRPVTIKGALRDSTRTETAVVKGKPPNAKRGWIGFAVGFVLGAVLMLVGIILLRRLTA